MRGKLGESQVSVLVPLLWVRAGREEWLPTQWVRATGQGFICILSGCIVTVLGDKGMLDMAICCSEEGGGVCLRALRASAMVPVGLTLPLTISWSRFPF